jgi:hypothetical protein
LVSDGVEAALGRQWARLEARLLKEGAKLESGKEHFDKNDKILRSTITFDTTAVK